jgi:hypothetical protein
MWQRGKLKGDSLPWLLEEGNPGVRYLAMRDLLNLPSDHTDVLHARECACSQGPIRAVLDEMDPAGYWVKPGAGYAPKYTGSVWSVIMLAQMGASVTDDPRIPQACGYLLDHALTENGQFSISGNPSDTIDCLQGNLCAAMLDLGFADPRLELAFEWMARSVTGEGVAPMGTKGTKLRYYSGKIGPGFRCGANNKLPCAWGAVKLLLAFGKLPPERRTALIEEAIRQGVDFLLEGDPAAAPYPNGWSERPSGNWWKFGFPVFYVTDLLQLTEALVRLGYGDDPRLENALKLIWEKQDEQGRWPMEYSYTGKTWIDFGEKKKANKWITLRAAWVLKHSAFEVE